MIHSIVGKNPKNKEAITIIYVAGYRWPINAVMKMNNET
jgi:hypothetical protein